ncbi:hypothetical protein R1sor_004675 [Riccia sorocarpa]|uniref:Uncharacterized protein n=1 Tax=Riccia sorocarpa TaxID=122646 RepID=A0ABD3HNU3_9MARC
MDETKAAALRDSQVGTLSTVQCVSTHLRRLITEKDRFVPRLKDSSVCYLGNFALTTGSAIAVGELLPNSLGILIAKIDGNGPPTGNVLAFSSFVNQPNASLLLTPSQFTGHPELMHHEISIFLGKIPSSASCLPSPLSLI